MKTLLIETERLLIAPVSLKDAPFIFTLLNTAAWKRFIGDRNIHNLEDAKNYIKNRFLAHYNEHGFGVYTVKLKDSRKPIGLCTLLKKPHLPNEDIGFAFLDEYTGKGYAYESAKAVYDYAKSTLGMARIVAVTNTDNVLSMKLLERLGFHFVEVIDSENTKLNLFADC